LESPEHSLGTLGSSSSACNQKIQSLIDMAPKKQRTMLILKCLSKKKQHLLRIFGESALRIAFNTSNLILTREQPKTIERGL